MWAPGMDIYPQHIARPALPRIRGVIQPTDTMPDMDRKEKYATTHEKNEAKAAARLKRLYPNVPEGQNLPRAWNKHDKGEFLQVRCDGERVWYPPRSAANAPGGGAGGERDSSSVRSVHPIPIKTGLYYYEIRIIRSDKFLGLGLCEKSVDMKRLPGWDKFSYGYHGDDGNFFSNSPNGAQYGPQFGCDDVVGCGVNLVTGEIFFTKNGKHLGSPMTIIEDISELYPCIGMQTSNTIVDVNFGQKPFMFDFASEQKKFRDSLETKVRAVTLPTSKRNYMNNAIASWLAHSAHGKALQAFIGEAGLSNDQKSVWNMADIDKRKEIAALIMNRRCGEAMSLIEEHFKGILDAFPSLHFDLKANQFVEILQAQAETAQFEVPARPTFVRVPDDEIAIDGLILPDSRDRTREIDKSMFTRWLVGEFAPISCPSNCPNNPYVAAWSAHDHTLPSTASRRNLFSVDSLLHDNATANARASSSGRRWTPAPARIDPWTMPRAETGRSHISRLQAARDARPRERRRLSTRSRGPSFREQILLARSSPRIGASSRRRDTLPGTIRSPEPNLHEHAKNGSAENGNACMKNGTSKRHAPFHDSATTIEQEEVEDAPIRDSEDDRERAGFTRGEEEYAIDRFSTIIDLGQELRKGMERVWKELGRGWQSERVEICENIRAALRLSAGRYKENFASSYLLQEERLRKLVRRMHRAVIMYTGHDGTSDLAKLDAGARRDAAMLRHEKSLFAIGPFIDFEAVAYGRTKQRRRRSRDEGATNGEARKSGSKKRSASKQSGNGTDADKDDPMEVDRDSREKRRGRDGRRDDDPDAPGPSSGGRGQNRRRGTGRSSSGGEGQRASGSSGQTVPGRSSAI